MRIKQPKFKVDSDSLCGARNNQATKARNNQVTKANE